MSQSEFVTKMVVVGGDLAQCLGFRLFAFGGWWGGGGRYAPPTNLGSKGSLEEHMPVSDACFYILTLY